MLYAFRDDGRRRITVTATGTVSFLDLATFVERQLAGDAWGYAVLHDGRAATTDVTAQDLSDIVGHMLAIADEPRRVSRPNQDGASGLRSPRTRLASSSSHK